MYICPSCNAIVDDSLVRMQDRRRQCPNGHKLWQVESFGLNIVQGIGITLGLSLLAALIIMIVPQWKVAVAVVTISFLGIIGIAGVLEGVKYSKMPEPSRKLAKQVFGVAGGELVTVAVLLVLSALRF